jgi:hypothetical protein
LLAAQSPVKAKSATIPSRTSRSRIAAVDPASEPASNVNATRRSVVVMRLTIVALAAAGGEAVDGTTVDGAVPAVAGRPVVADSAVASDASVVSAPLVVVAGWVAVCGAVERAIVVLADVDVVVATVVAGAGHVVGAAPPPPAPHAATTRETAAKAARCRRSATDAEGTG